MAANPEEEELDSWLRQLVRKFGKKSSGVWVGDKVSKKVSAPIESKCRRRSFSDETHFVLMDRFTPC